jgi:hypothetical protein
MAMVTVMVTVMVMVIVISCRVPAETTPANLTLHLFAIAGASLIPHNNR